MKQWQRLFSVLIGSVSIVLSGQAQAIEPATAHKASEESIIPQIIDPAARAAAEEIQKKITAIQDYQCTIDMEQVIPMGKIVRRVQETIKRPNFYRRDQDTVEITIPNFGKGEWYTFITDGKTVWEAMGPAPRDLASPSTPMEGYFLYDVERVKKAGGNFFTSADKGSLLRPLVNDLSKMKISREDDEVWVFSDGSHEATVGKKDGLLRERRWVINADSFEKSTYSNIKVNTGVSSETFALSLKPGTEIKDITKDKIADAKAAKEKKQ